SVPRRLVQIQEGEFALGPEAGRAATDQRMTEGYSGKDASAIQIQLLQNSAGMRGCDRTLEVEHHAIPADGCGIGYLPQGQLARLNWRRHRRDEQPVVAQDGTVDIEG